MESPLLQPGGLFRRERWPPRVCASPGFRGPLTSWIAGPKRGAAFGQGINQDTEIFADGAGPNDPIGSAQRELVFGFTGFEVQQHELDWSSIAASTRPSLENLSGVQLPA